MRSKIDCESSDTCFAAKNDHLPSEEGVNISGNSVERISTGSRGLSTDRDDVSFVLIELGCRLAERLYFKMKTGSRTGKAFSRVDMSAKVIRAE